MVVNDPQSPELLTIDEFLALSAELNYQLSAEPLNPRAILSLIVGPEAAAGGGPLLRAIDVLQLGYDQQRRRLGPAAILHPLRTAAILARATRPSTLDLLCALLHDKEEDLRSDNLGTERWEQLERRFTELLEAIDGEVRWYLGERLDIYTRKPGTTYVTYIARVLDRARAWPGLLPVKLADKLDSTYDVVVARPGALRYDLFQSTFDLLFTSGGRVAVEPHHLPIGDAGGRQILTNLFKNTLVLSLLRKEGLDTLDAPTRRLFRALCAASSRAAQWLTLETFGAHITAAEDQRLIVAEMMRYCGAGGIGAVRAPGEQVLDGLFLNAYGVNDSGRRDRLAGLYANKELLARTALVFVAVFASFVNDPAYFVRGIDREGLWPVD